MQLLFDYPWYLLFFCLLAGAAYSALLYWRQRQHLWLAVIRFVVVSLIAALLMAPLVKRKVNSHQRPIVVVATDHSESIDNPLPQGWCQALEKDYDLVLDTFGGKSTDIAAELSSIADRYAGRNLGAVVLATDGIYNQGQNPSLMAASLAAPIYTIAQGDTTHRRDASIASVRAPKVAYLGNQFPMEINLRAYRLKGEHALLTVSRNGQRLFSQNITYPDNQYSATIPVTLNAEKAGLQSYSISLTPVAGELSTANNSRTIAVEVLDGHQKIAILAAAPHPDVSAFKQAIEANPNYEVSVFTGKYDISQLREYSLLILHNLPTAEQPLKNLADLRLPTVFVIGTTTDLARFNALRSGMEIIAKARKSDEVTPSHNNSFALFTFDDNLCQQLEQMPPLQAPFGTYRPAGDVQSLFTAKIGSVATDRPLIAFSQQEGIRHTFIIGEGLWRWRLQDYLMNSSHTHFNQLVEKIVVYTSLQTNKDRFHLVYNHIYAENESVTISAELYNENYELVNTPAAQLVLTGNGSSTDYDFNRSGNGYALNLGTLAPGEYKIAASATLAGKSLQASGTFVVEAVNLEQMNLVADHALLNTLSQTTGGEMLTPEQIDQLPQFLQQRTDLKSVLYTHTRYTELLNIPWIFILIVLLLGIEWGVRKYNDLW